MAYNNNFGSNSPNVWELSAQDLAALASSHVDRGAEETSFDDLFDGPSYRVAQSAFAGQGHRLMPRGQTHYRPTVDHPEQGMPRHLSSSHWGHLPDNTARRRAETMGGRNNNFGLASHMRASPAHVQYMQTSPPHMQHMQTSPYNMRHMQTSPAYMGAPSVRNYNFAG
jgi:hypothetical protein